MFSSRVRSQTLTWLTWPRHPWKESMWEQPAPWLQTFLQLLAATATGWWLHPAVWGKTSPPPPPLSSVSQTGSPLVITLSHSSVFACFSFFLSFFLSFLLSFFLSFFLFFFFFFSLFLSSSLSSFPDEVLFLPAELAYCWFLVVCTAIILLFIVQKQSVLEVNFASGVS